MPTNKSVKKWYEAHSETYNAKRREEYAHDPEGQFIARVRARNYRERKAKGEEIKRILHREVGTFSGVVYSTGQVAEYIGKSAQCIRNWHTRGWLPAPVFGGKHRLYTQDQAQLIKKLSTFVDQDGDGWTVTREELIAEILKSW